MTLNSTYFTAIDRDCSSYFVILNVLLPFFFRRQAKKKSTFYKRISDYDDLDKMKVRFLSFYEHEVFNKYNPSSLNLNFWRFVYSS